MGNLKKAATITIDPEIWLAFQNLVKDKQPDGDKSASAHVETLVRREVAKIQSSNMPDVVDRAALQRQLLSLKKRYNDILKAQRKREGAMVRFDKLAEAYDLDMRRFSNVADVIHRVLEDRRKERSPVQDFLDGQPESDLTLFISMIEIKAEIHQTNTKLLEAREAHYSQASTQEQSEKEEEEKPTHVETKHTQQKSTPEDDNDEEEEEEEEDPDYYKTDVKEDWHITEE
jgi:hypothetical protein